MICQVTDLKKEAIFLRFYSIMIESPGELDSEITLAGGAEQTAVKGL